MKTNSTHWGLILALAVAISFCHGCKSIGKATQQVLTDSTAFTKVGNIYLGLHPCNPIVISSKSDTTYQHDTTTVSYLDTVGLYVHDTIIKKIRTTATIHDTTTIVDGQQIAILKSQIANERLSNAVLNKGLTDTQLNDAAILAKLQKEKDNDDYWLWGILAAIGVGVLWKVFSWSKSGTPVETLKVT